MALVIGLSRGVARAAQPETPTLDSINAKMLADWQASDFAELSLDGSSLSELAEFIAAVAANQEEGNFENYAPFNNSMVKVFVDTEKSFPICWVFNGILYGRSEDGLSTVSINDVIATF